MSAPGGPPIQVPPNPIQVRRAGEPDLPALVRLRRSWAEQRNGLVPGADPGFEQGFAAWWRAEAPRRAFWLAEVGDTHGGVDAVGSLNVVEFVAMPAPGQPGHRPDRWGYVGNVVVLDGFAARGVPRLLLSAAIGYAHERGFSRLVLRPSAAGAAFYRAAGFTPAGGDMVVLETRPAAPSTGEE